MQAGIVNSKGEIIRRLQLHRRQLNRLGVRRIGLFGSFIRDEQQDTSDVDFLVEFEPDKKTFRNFMHLSFLLEEMLHRPVELVTRESLSRYIGPRILQEVEYVSIAD